MMKRKNDEIWRTIQYIQNFIRPKKNPFEIINVYCNLQNDRLNLKDLK